MAKDLSCCVGFMRGLLLFLNVLFIIAGITLIGIGIYIKVDNNFSSILSDLANNDNFKGQSLGFLAWIMIGGGVVTVLIALFGCVGTLWHNRCLLYLYAIILAILMITELAAFIMAFVYKGELKSVYEESLTKVFKDAFSENKADAIGAFHSLEAAMKCCGVNNVSDYNQYPSAAPPDFCKDNATAPTGCSEVIITFLNKSLPIIGGTLGGVLLLELFGLIAAIALAVALKHAPDGDYSSNPRDVISKIVPRRR